MTVIRLINLTVFDKRDRQYFTFNGMELMES